MLLKNNCVKKLFCILACVIFIAPYLCACNSNASEQEIPPFVTMFTEKENEARAIEKVKNAHQTQINSGKIKNIYAYTVYSFYANEPQFILVEVQYVQPLIGTMIVYEDSITCNRIHFQTEYTCTLFKIVDEELVYTPTWRGGTKWGHNYGRSPWHALGLENNKKYYGCDDYGVEIDGKIYKFFSDMYMGRDGAVDIYLGEEYWQRDYRAILEESVCLTSEECYKIYLQEYKKKHWLR